MWGMWGMWGLRGWARYYLLHKAVKIEWNHLHQKLGALETWGRAQTLTTITYYSEMLLRTQVLWYSPGSEGNICVELDWINLVSTECYASSPFLISILAMGEIRKMGRGTGGFMCHYKNQSLCISNIHVMKQNSYVQIGIWSKNNLPWEKKYF